MVTFCSEKPTFSRGWPPLYISEIEMYLWINSVLGLLKYCTKYQVFSLAVKTPTLYMGIPVFDTQLWLLTPDPGMQ